MSYYLMGLIMGAAYVAPIGMQNLFVINSAVSQPRWRAYATALIVIFWDVSLALACFFGVGGLISRSSMLEHAIMFIGGIVVVYIGIGLLRSKETAQSSAGTDMPLRKVITAAFAVTWLNPQALIDGSLLIGATRASLPDGADVYFIVGFTSASLLWFSGLSTVFQLFSAKVTPKLLHMINLVCGVVIVFYGLKLLAGLWV